MIISSLISIGEKRIGGTLTADEGTHYLAKFNTFLESLSQERLMIYQIKTDSFALSANTSTYTIGTNGTIATDRPNHIVSAQLKDSAGYDHPIEIVDYDTYLNLGAKRQTAEWPEVLWYDNSFSATSTGTIHFAPVPTATETVFIHSWKQLANAAALSTNVLLPPGYQRMLESNFALEVTPGLVDPPAMLVKIARDSKASLKTLNQPNPILSLDSGVAGAQGSNILDGP